MLACHHHHAAVAVAFDIKAQAFARLDKVKGTDRQFVETKAREQTEKQVPDLVQEGVKKSAHKIPREQEQCGEHIDNALLTLGHGEHVERDTAHCGQKDEKKGKYRIQSFFHDFLLRRARYPSRLSVSDTVISS